MIVVGLTGSIGMGKSTTAKLFAGEGIPVNDADAAVHALYTGRAVEPIAKAFPEAIEDGVVNRAFLSRTLTKNPAKFRELEQIVHPLVRDEEKRFIERQRGEGADMVVLDIPLLFETEGSERVDVIVVVSAGEAVQRERVLARPGMTVEKFELLKSRQVPDAEKRRRADFVIDTGHGIDAARLQVREIIAKLRATSQD